MAASSARGAAGTHQWPAWAPCTLLARAGATSARPASAEGGPREDAKPLILIGLHKCKKGPPDFLLRKRPLWCRRGDPGGTPCQSNSCKAKALKGDPGRPAHCASCKLRHVYSWINTLRASWVAGSFSSLQGKFVYQPPEVAVCVRAHGHNYGR